MSIAIPARKINRANRSLLHPDLPTISRDGSEFTLYVPDRTLNATELRTLVNVICRAIDDAEEKEKNHRK